MVEDNMITLTSILHHHGSPVTTLLGVNLVKILYIPRFPSS